jgi:hypothetical protein
MLLWSYSRSFDLWRESKLLNMLQILDKQTQLEILEERFRRESFAQHYASGVPVTKAMRMAGYVQPTRDKAVALLQESDVQKEIDSCLALLRESRMNSKEALIAELDFNREFAIEQENPAAAVAATLGKAKLLGYLDNDKSAKVPAKIEITWNDGDGPHKETVRESSPLYEGIKDSVT